MLNINFAKLYVLRGDLPQKNEGGFFMRFQLTRMIGRLRRGLKPCCTAYSLIRTKHKEIMRRNQFLYRTFGWSWLLEKI